MEPFCQDAEVGKIEFEARLGIERHYVALGDAERVQARGDFVRGLPVIVPGISEVTLIAVPDGLA